MAEPQRKYVDYENGDRWLDGYLPYHLYRVTNRLNARLIGRLKAIGINASEWRVLSVLRSYGTLSVGGIAERTLMEQPTVSRVVNQLEKQSMVSRSPSLEDSRVTDVTLTDAGNDAFNSIAPSALRHEENALGGFTRQEISVLKKYLERIEANIELDS